MTLKWSPRLLSGGVMVASGVIVMSCIPVTARGEEGVPRRASEVAPRKPAGWHLHIAFAGGAPGERLDRFTYEIAVSSSGEAKFENLRQGGKKRVALFEGKLDKEELVAVYEAAAAAINR